MQVMSISYTTVIANAPYGWNLTWDTVPLLCEQFRKKCNEISKNFVSREVDQIHQLFSYIYFYIDLAITMLEQI